MLADVEPCRPKLQWGRGAEAAERTAPRAVQVSAVWLQWGRGAEAAEESSTARNADDLELQWGRGAEAAESEIAAPAALP